MNCSVCTILLFKLHVIFVSRLFNSNQRKWVIIDQQYSPMMFMAKAMSFSKIYRTTTPKTLKLLTSVCQQWWLYRLGIVADLWYKNKAYKSLYFTTNCTQKLNSKWTNCCMQMTTYVANLICLHYYKEHLLRQKKLQLHRPGIEPGPPAWQASILPLNHRCLLDILQFHVYQCVYFICKILKMFKFKFKFLFKTCFNSSFNFSC